MEGRCGLEADITPPSLATTWITDLHMCVPQQTNMQTHMDRCRAVINTNTSGTHRRVANNHTPLARRQAVTVSHGFTATNAPETTACDRTASSFVGKAATRGVVETGRRGDLDQPQVCCRRSLQRLSQTAAATCMSNMERFKHNARQVVRVEDMHGQTNVLGMAALDGATGWWRACHGCAHFVRASAGHLPSTVW